MKIKTCVNCGPSEVDVDDKLGHVVCLGCGTVLESDTIVSELTFSETTKGAAVTDGFALQAGQARAKPRGGTVGRMSVVSHYVLELT